MVSSGKIAIFAQNYIDLLMRRNLLICLLAIMAMVVLPGQMLAIDMAPAAVEQGDESVSIGIDGQVVTVSGAQGKTLEIVSLTGKVIKTIAIESPSQRIELNIPKGCYILKVGKVVRKVSVR